jgi:Tfp pilus assembly protein PilF
LIRCTFFDSKMNGHRSVKKWRRQPDMNLKRSSPERAAEHFAKQALQADLDQGSPHVVLAILSVYPLERTEAEHEFTRAIRADEPKRRS